MREATSRSDSRDLSLRSASILVPGARLGLASKRFVCRIDALIFDAPGRLEDEPDGFGFSKRGFFEVCCDLDEGPLEVVGADRLLYGLAPVREGESIELSPRTALLPLLSFGITSLVVLRL